MTPDEWRQRVGLIIQQRREQLRLSVRSAATRAGFSEGQWRQMESGRRAVAAQQFVTVNPRPSTRSAACAALLWTEDSIDRLEAGQEAIALATEDGHEATLRQLDDSRTLVQLRTDLESLRRAHLALADIVSEFVGARPSPIRRAAAEGANGPTPTEIGPSVPRPQPPAENGDHVVD